MNTIFVEAEGDFPFQFHIEKAEPIEKDGEFFVTGVASTLNIDHDNERMSKEALVQMANVINEKSVPLRIEHQKSDEAIIGKVYEAHVDERNQLWVKASLDKSNAVSNLLYKSLKEGVKLGLSVGGRVKKATRELVESAGKFIKTFYDIVLDEVSVTQRPANYDAWLFAKSIVKPGGDVTEFYSSTQLRNEFLFTNPQLDYLQVIAKSIPDQAWKPVEKKSNDMSKEEIKKADTDSTQITEKEDSKTDETKYASMEHIKALEKAMAAGFEQLGGLIGSLVTKMTETTEDTKEEKSGADGGRTSSDAGNGEDTEGQREKAMDDTTDETKEKAETDEEDTKEKTETEDDKTKSEHGDEYQMPVLTSAMKQINSIKEILAKSQKEEAKKDVKKSANPTIDEFISALTSAVENLVQKSAKDGKRLVGFESAIADLVRNDVEIQKAMTEMMKQPGLKKSVVSGVPFMKTKDGKTYQLGYTEVGVEKSENSKSGKDFKSLYKSDYSSQSAESSN